MKSNNREFKFRVWDMNKNGWITTGIGEPIDGNLISCVDIAQYVMWPKDYVIQQFTGLQDKDGRDIYEGDIIKTPPANLFQKNIRAVAYHRNGFFPDDIAWNKKDVKVIGNIFENSDLLN
jgi:uncharacterized phage protein (TIGR01671 family)